jgi:antitoxin component HigA of HigAB toxin-antitoxin module
MKTLLTKELYKVYREKNEDLLKIICQYEDENDIPQNVREQYIEVTDALIAYEKAYHPLPWEVSTLITDEIKSQMEKKHLKQRGLGKLLGIDESRVSELMNGKRALNLNVVKKLHTELNIPADFLLAHS